MNLVEKLAREIARIAVMRERARELPGSCGNFLVVSTTDSLEFAFKAIGSGEISPMMVAVQNLQEYKD